MKKIGIVICFLIVATVIITLYVLFWKHVLVIIVSVLGAAFATWMSEAQGPYNQASKDVIAVGASDLPRPVAVLLVPVWLALCWVAVIIDLLGMVYQYLLPSPPRRWMVPPM